MPVTDALALGCGVGLKWSREEDVKPERIASGSNIETTLAKD